MSSTIVFLLAIILIYHLGWYLDNSQDTIVLTSYKDSIPTRNTFVSIFFLLPSVFLPLIPPFSP